MKVRIGYNYVNKPKVTTHYTCIRVCVCILDGCSAVVVRCNVLQPTAVWRYGRMATSGWTGAWVAGSTRAVERERERFQRWDVQRERELLLLLKTRFCESNVYWTVHHCNSWGMKNQLDVTCYFISIIMRSTCFEQYIHLQEPATLLMNYHISRLVLSSLCVAVFAATDIWCFSCYRLLKMDILMSKTCWAHNNWNKIKTDIKLVFHPSTIAMMHGPINIRYLMMFIRW